MKTVNVTITSKNQITLPVAYVRNLNLQKGRRLTVTRRGDELILKPEVSATERFAAHWREMPTVVGTKTDADFQQAIRDAYRHKEV